MTSHPRLRPALALAVILSSGLPISWACAQSQPPAPAARQDAAPLTFDQFKSGQMQHLSRAQGRLAQRLGDSNVPADQRQRLERQKAQLDKFAVLPPEQQDQVLHRRFDRIDTDHDGTIDAGELKAFREAQRQQHQMKQDAGGKSDDFWPSPN